MLFKLSNDLSSFEAHGFEDLSRHEGLEKDLENLIARNLFDRLFEDMLLLPFHQERPLQPEADIYALNKEGDVVIFELKRGPAGDDALGQLFRYAQAAGRWKYTDINAKYNAYPEREGTDNDVASAHQHAFGLDQPLKNEEFNRTQRLCVVGSAANEALMNAVDFWRQKGISIDFSPYRIYTIKDELYFEFYAKPYDWHLNPAETKGVLFDTCRTRYPEALELMVRKRRISAYGGRKDAVRSLAKGDIVFYSHAGFGLVAAARVTGRSIKPDGDSELYWDVEFLTPVPERFDVFPNAMPFSTVKEVTGKSFFWARIQKYPYLSREDGEKLLQELRKQLGADSAAAR